MPHDFSIAITAPVVAWYAAVVATTSLGINGYVAWWDRPRIKVTAGINYKVSGGVGGYDTAKKHILVNVANAGRRPVTITHVYLKHRKAKHYSLFKDALVRGPTELGEGKAAQFLMEQDRVDLADIKAVIVTDATGREWKGKLKGAD